MAGMGNVSRSMLQAGFFKKITIWFLCLFVGKVVECGPSLPAQTRVLNLSYVNVF